MDSTRGQVAASAAHTYEQFFVPALFGPWGPRVAEALAPHPGGRALDVACGTGVLARSLARRIGAEAVAGVDCNEGMLAVAWERAPDIDWRWGRAEALPFEAEQFDAVGCQFGLMFFEDRAAALQEMWRVLKPSGRLAVAVWGSLEETPGYAAVVSLLQRLFGTEIADALRAPFVLGDTAELADLFDTAGLPSAQIETVIEHARFPSIRDWMRTDIKGWTLADRIDDDQIARLQQEAETSLRAFARPDGRVEFEAPARIAVLSKP